MTQDTVSHLIAVETDTPTPSPVLPKHPNAGIIAANLAPRCHAHTRTGQTCKKPAINGMVVCRQHGGNAPQVREAARLRMAMAVAPALKRLVTIITKGEDHAAMAAIREVLARNELYGFGVEPKPTGAGFHPSVTVQTQVNMPDAPLASMSDGELARYKDLLLELRALAPKDVPKRLNSVTPDRENS